MKNNAILVNTARQELINKNDLYEIIKDRKINTVSMDGFYVEPTSHEVNDEYLDLDYD